MRLQETREGFQVHLYSCEVADFGPNTYYLQGAPQVPYLVPRFKFRIRFLIPSASQLLARA